MTSSPFPAVWATPIKSIAQEKRTGGVLSASDEKKRYNLSYTHLVPSIKLTNEIFHFFPGDKLVNISPKEKRKAREEKVPQILNVFIYTSNIIIFITGHQIQCQVPPSWSLLRKTGDTEVNLKSKHIITIRKKQNAMIENMGMKVS